MINWKNAEPAFCADSHINLWSCRKKLRGNFNFLSIVLHLNHMDKAPFESVLMIIFFSRTTPFCENRKLHLFPINCETTLLRTILCQRKVAHLCVPQQLRAAFKDKSTLADANKPMWEAFFLLLFQLQSETARQKTTFTYWHTSKANQRAVKRFTLLNLHQ